MRWNAVPLLTARGLASLTCQIFFLKCEILEVKKYLAGYYTCLNFYLHT